jgi:sarcosine oxidase
VAGPRLVTGDGAREFVVVGAGLLGLAAARALSLRGREVTVLEQARVGGVDGGSHGSCRIFRLGYDDPGYVRMARRARGLWDELEQQAGLRLLHPTPQLSFGAGLEPVRSAMAAADEPCELLPAAEAAARFPGVTVGGPALVEPDSCVIAAGDALRALAGGVPDIREGTEVTGIADDGRRVTVRTGTGSLTARAAIVCAGPWTARLLTGAGVTVPSASTLEQVAYLSPMSPAAIPPPGMPPPAATPPPEIPPPEMPIFISHGERSPYGLPVPGSPRYKVGIHRDGPAVDPGLQERGADPRLGERLAAMARRYLPGFDPVPAVTERCVYDNSPDTDFIIDRAGLIVVASGTSGHGFKFGPLLGEWLADLATGEADQPDPRFALGRFGRAAADGASR